MIPILFASEKTLFTTQGLGALSECTKCIVTEERNGQYELELCYPVTGKHYADLALSTIILATPAWKKDEEPFRVYKISRPIGGIVTVNAEHISYQLSHIPVMPFTASTAADAVDKLKTYSTETNPFTFWTDKSTAATMTVTAPASCRSLLGGSSGSVLDVYGGEYEFTGYTVKLHGARGQNRGVTIRYGKNLTDLNQEENIENTITGICPFWQKDDTVVTLSEKVIHSSTAKNFPYQRTVVKDFSSDFDEQPTEDELREAANKYIAQTGIGIPKVSIDVSFVALSQYEEYKDIALLEQVNLCDTVTVQFEALGIDATAKVIKTEYNTLTDSYESVELGESRTNLTKTVSNLETETEEKIQESTSSLQKAITTATNLITGNSGGYVVLHKSSDDGMPYEILIMDTPDINTATKVWRWNNGGLGYSGNGYNGPYTTAITQDGRMVADFISTGTLDANKATITNLKASQITVGETTVDKSLDNLQDQIDGTIETFTGTTAPTLTNYPTNTWETTEYDQHCGDLFVGAESSEIQGFWYRFQKAEDGTYSWVHLKDNDIQKAIADASEAKTAVNNSIGQVDVEYYKSTSATELSGGSWQSTAPQWEQGCYIWTRTKTVSNDGRSTSYSEAACVTGNNGTNGTGITSVTELYYCSDSATIPSKPTAHVTTSSAITYNAWNLTCPTYTTTYKYYFTCSEILYSNGSYGWSTVVSNSGYETANSVAASASTTAGNAKTAADDAKSKTDGLSTGTTTIDGGCIKTGTIKSTDENSNYELNMATGEVVMKSATIKGGKIDIDSDTSSMDFLNLRYQTPDVSGSYGKYVASMTPIILTLLNSIYDTETGALKSTISSSLSPGSIEFKSTALSKTCKVDYSGISYDNIYSRAGRMTLLASRATYGFYGYDVSNFESYESFCLVVFRGYKQDDSGNRHLSAMASTMIQKDIVNSSTEETYSCWVTDCQDPTNYFGQCYFDSSNSKVYLSGSSNQDCLVRIYGMR